MSDPSGSNSGIEPPDIAFAVVLSSLRHMTPARLRVLLDGRSAREVYGQVLTGDSSLIDPLARIGEPGRTDSSAQSLDMEVNWGSSGSLGAMERARAQVRDSLRSWRLEAARIPVKQRWDEMLARGIGAVRRGDPAYPQRLLRARRIPELLYVRGRLDHVSAPCVGIVGTRRATHYGLEMAAELGRELAARGIVVVSGLARGIDAAAHHGVLAARQDELGASESVLGAQQRPNGPLAVVGGGVDVVYPRENRRLWEEVVVTGGLVSEAPPGARPESWRFPLRNRIIAALSQVLVVVESSRQGGAMHTVLAADAYGVPVLAVPGSVRSPQSEGTNAIIQEGGAGVVLDVHDILAILELECLQDGTPVSFSPLRPPEVRRAPVSTSWQSAPGRWPEAGIAGDSFGGVALAGSAGGAQPVAAEPGSVAVGPAQQVMDLMIGDHAQRRAANAQRQRTVARCTPTERAVLEALDDTTTLLDLVCLRTNLDLGLVALAIDRLDALGLVCSDGPGWIRL